LLKPSRYVATTPHAKRYTADIAQRFVNEICAWDLLHRGDVEVVSLVGVYSTEAHPFGIVYECMDGLDLKQYSKHESKVARLKLVLVPSHLLSVLSITL
jgi:hypothetical protein